MARAKTVWIASDGTEWDSENKAIARDNLDVAVQAIEAMLPKPPNDSGSRIQVDMQTVARAKELIVELCRAQFPNEPVFQHPAEDIHPFSYAGRLLDDVGGPLRRAWWLFSVIRDGWMYEQPFYALNPDRFRGVAK